MHYVDHVDELMIEHNATGYFYKTSNDLIGFWDGPQLAWYRRNGNERPIRVERGTPEEEFNRLKDATFNKLKWKI